MADVTISGLSLNTPNKNSAVIPYSDGSTTYRTAPSGIVAASPGSILQVQSNTSDTIIGPITNNDSALISVSIKPISTSSKIYVTSDLKWSSQNPNGGFSLQRSINGGAFTNISKGYVSVTGGSDPGGSWPTRVIDGIYVVYDEVPGDSYTFSDSTYSILDTTHNTTDTIVYRSYWYHLVRNGGTFYLNRPSNQSSSAYWSGLRGSSTITAMEIAG